MENNLFKTFSQVKQKVEILPLLIRILITESQILINNGGMTHYELSFFHVSMKNSQNNLSCQLLNKPN